MDWYFYVGAYALVLIAVSLYLFRKNSKEDFLISGRNRSTFAILASKFAGAVGVSTFITYTGYAYQFGIGVFGLLLGGIIGYLLFALWAAPRVKKMSLKGKFYTQGDLTLCGKR